MYRTTIAGVGVWLLLLTTAWAFEAVGTIKRVDAEQGVVVLLTGGNQERTVKTSAQLKVLDEKGTTLADGLKSDALRDGVVATFTVEPQNNEPVIQQIRIGRHANQDGGKGGSGAPSPKLTPKTSVGFKPLTEMSASDRYQDQDGGLYGGGQNTPPAEHLAAAERETARIVPLDKSGQPSSDGQIVLVSISMSNATQEFSMFKQVADNDPQHGPRVTIVDCAQGGQAMAQWVSPDARPWSEAMRRIEQAGVTPQQVQVAWVKLANVRPMGDLATHGAKLKNDTREVVRNAKARFPNLRIVYLASRIYGGYGESALNPEPYAYEGAFAARWLIQDQIKGDDSVNFDASRGKVVAPVLLWGPYLWADGVTPRKSDGLSWVRDDFSGDGTHPSNAGRMKVAEQLLGFFRTDPLAKTWFLGGKSVN